MSKAQIINGLIDKIGKVMRVAMPASIVTYDFKNQNASVQIQLKERSPDGNIDYPIISNVLMIG